MPFRPFQSKKTKTRVSKKKVSQTKMDEISLEEERVYREGTIALRDLIAPSAFRVESNFLQLGTVFLRTTFVITYPRFISVGWSAPLLNINSTIDIGMFFYDLTQGVEHFFQFAFYVTMYAESKDALDKLTEDVENIFGSRLIYIKNVLFQAEQGFTSTLPLAIDELAVSFNMNSSPIASSFPFMSSELTSDDGILYGINRHNNSLILFDRFSLQNANMVVFATSGAGKSYAVKLEILRSLMMGIDVIVIDPEMEYAHLSEAVGGTYVNISLSSESKVNPFDLPRPIGQEVSTEDIIRSGVITTKGL